MAFTGVTNEQLLQEVTKPKAVFKPTLPKKSGVYGGAIRCQHILLSFQRYVLSVVPPSRFETQNRLKTDFIWKNKNAQRGGELKLR